MKRADAARVLSRSGLRAALGLAWRWSGVLCVNYHRVGDGRSSVFDRELWSAGADDFDQQLRFLASHADVVTPRDLPEILRKGRGRFVLITFDDGYRDNFDVAFPLLMKHRLAATFFVTTGFIDSPALSWWDEIAWMVRTSPGRGVEPGGGLASAVVFDEPHRDRAVRTLLTAFKSMPAAETPAYLDYLAAATGSGRWSGARSDTTWMTWDMVREMRDAGMVIGGHTVTHPVLARLAPERQRAEIDGCARRLLEELGEPMTCFSYPVGSRQAFDGETRACLTRAGVKYAFSYYGGLSGFSTWDDLDIRRVSIERDMDLDWFKVLTTLPMVFGRER